jgi:predicted GIY-YIG superfamily endonuclease
MKKDINTYVYFILNENDGLVKIGYSKSPLNRLKQLQTSNGNKLKLIYYVLGDKNVEYAMHLRFKDFKVSGEWFEYDDLIKNWIRLDRLTREMLINEGIM